MELYKEIFIIRPALLLILRRKNVWQQDPKELC